MEHVQKSFGDKEVLHDVSFAVDKGEVFGLLGPSGAGKTTIINILIGQVRADGGRHSVGAKHFETGLMLDEDGLYVRLSAIQNLNLFADIYGIGREKSIAALEDVGLSDAGRKPVSALSRGMRQRLQLARAILHEPKVLFLDEPTSGLDPGGAKSIHGLIGRLQERGTTMLLTTHNMEEAGRLCNHIALLHKGVIIERGVPAEICERHNAVKTIPDLEAVFIKLTGVGLE